MTHFTPENAAQIREAVAWAVAEGEPLSVRGGGSKTVIGRPINTAHELDISKISGIDLYEPDELILRAGAGTPLSEIEAVLAENNQRLEFEPPNLASLLGLAAGAETRGTLGGAIASNYAGPRRIKSGAARDHFLGFEAVSGRAEDFKSGGRVMKNVTGYDLCKLMAGSWGTLGVMTQITVKVLPVAEKQRTLLLACDDGASAVKALTEALNSPYEVSGAAWLPRDLAQTSELDRVKALGAGVAAIRLEGPAPSVSYRCQKLQEMFSTGTGIGTGRGTALEELHTHNSEVFWLAIRDVAPLCESGDTGISSNAVWRISTAPSHGAALLSSLSERLNARGFLDWGGGLLWLSVPIEQGVSPLDGGASAIREAIQSAGGHASLIKGGADLRGSISVFHPLAPGLDRLTEKIKQGFDPSGVLNPGRMYDGV